MKKYHLYNAVQRVKNALGGAATAMGQNPFVDDDIKLLASMSLSAKMRISNSGGTYWYYCATDENNNDIAKFILLRNGVNVMQHNSRLYNPRRKVLRVSQRYLKKNAKAGEFVKRVSEMQELYGAISMSQHKERVQQQMQR